MRLAWLVVAILASGCLQAPSSPSTDAGPEPNTPDTPNISYSYACPPGGAGDPCHVAFASPGQLLGEPRIAVDPYNANRIALTASAQFTFQPVQDPPAVNTRQSVLYVTNDGGQNWLGPISYPDIRLDSGLLFPPDNDLTTVNYAPSVLYQGERIHWFSHVTQTEYFVGDLYHISSDDDGQTWSTPHFVTAATSFPESADIVAADGFLAVPITPPGSEAHGLALSADGGRTWSERVTDPVELDCQSAGAVAAGGRLGSVCGLSDREGLLIGMDRVSPGFVVSFLEPRAAKPAAGEGPRAPDDPSVQGPPSAMGPNQEVSLPHACVPSAAPLGDQGLVVAATGCMGPPPGQDVTILSLVTSDDGENWTEPMDLVADIGFVQDWGKLDVPGMASDPFGRIHMVVEGAMVPYMHGLLDPVAPKGVGHVIFDPVTRQVILAQALGTLPFASMEDLGHIAWAPDGAWLAWVDQGVLHLTRVITR